MGAKSEFKSRGLRLLSRSMTAKTPIDFRTTTDAELPNGLRFAREVVLGNPVETAGP